MGAQEEVVEDLRYEDFQSRLQHDGTSIPQQRL